ncbi:acyl carrier protein [archaeon]|jgi:acyl carrier protein|nr:acyl carrier protein [archaeon]|tara:strand:+ start:1253 stop:1486 length:234 start_codon:yes stop_codon:yes gene_type:complete
MEKVKQIIGNVIGYESHEVEMSDDLEYDLGFDSLDAVECLMDLEREFQITIHDDRAMKCKTVEDVHKLLDSYGVKLV